MTKTQDKQEAELLLQDLDLKIDRVKAKLQRLEDQRRILCDALKAQGYF